MKTVPLRDAVRDTCAELFGSVDCIIGTMGQEERVRTATTESAKRSARKT